MKIPRYLFVALIYFSTISAQKWIVDEDNRINLFLRPVKFNSFSLKEFYQNRFNSTFYAEKFLPSCFIHIIDFLEHGKKANYPRSYIKSVFDLFNQRLLESKWTNAYALLAFMEHLPELLEPYILFEENEHKKIKRTIKKKLKEALVKKFSLLRKNPEKFLEDTSLEISKAISEDEEEGNSERDLQYSVTGFLVGAISKLIWNPYDNIDVWKSVKLIAEKCEELYDFDIVRTENDLNFLIWSLLYRFGYFINCAGSQMGGGFYKRIIKEIKEDNLVLLNPCGQEKLITTKREYLEKKIGEGKIKLSASETGIITDAITCKPQ